MLFVTGTGTGVGKTWFSLALIRAWRECGYDVLALKPFETGCDPDPDDAIALAEACGKPHLAHLEGFFRAELPVAPWATNQPIDLEGIRAQLDALGNGGRFRGDGAVRVLVEGAGGPLVPLTADLDIADWAVGKFDSVVLVAADQLGVQSHTFTAVESLRKRDLPLRAVVLNATELRDPSQETNLAMLQARLDVPVFSLRWGGVVPAAVLEVL